MKRLSAVDALGRGAANARANLELVVISTLGSVVIALLVILSVLPWLVTLGVDLDDLVGKGPDPQQLEELLGRLTSGGGLLARLGGLLLSLTFALTIASVLYGWYQGGTLGVLVAGDAQAPQGAGRESILFRTWSPRFFLHEAQRLTWRVILFLSLIFGIWSVLGALAVALFVGAGLLGSERGVAAGCAVACGTLLPLLFVSFVLMAVTQIGQADLVRPESGVLAATRNGFSILGRRLGAAAALLAMVLVISFGFGIAGAAIGLFGDFLLSSQPVLHFVFRAVLMLLQLVSGSLVNLVSAAAFVALVRSESALPEPA